MTRSALFTLSFVPPWSLTCFIDTSSSPLGLTWIKTCFHFGRVFESRAPLWKLIDCAVLSREVGSSCSFAYVGSTNRKLWPNGLASMLNLKMFGHALGALVMTCDDVISVWSGSSRSKSIQVFTHPGQVQAKSVWPPNASSTCRYLLPLAQGFAIVKFILACLAKFSGQFSVLQGGPMRIHKGGMSLVRFRVRVGNDISWSIMSRL